METCQNCGKHKPSQEELDDLNQWIKMDSKIGPVSIEDGSYWPDNWCDCEDENQWY